MKLTGRSEGTKAISEQIKCAYDLRSCPSQLVGFFYRCNVKVSRVSVDRALMECTSACTAPVVTGISN